MRRTCGALIIAAAAAWSPFALAEDVVHFSNGAEMTVRSHTIEKDMVKLDLGGNSFITFPVSMVEKIVSAGKNVFLNPVYHPSNQALPVAPGDLPSPLPDRTIRGGGVPVGYRLGQSETGTGLRLGEAANNDDNYGSGRATTIQSGRAKNFSTPQPRRFNALSPQPIGTKQTIDPPAGSPARTREQIQIVIPPDPLAAPAESDSQPEQAPADPEPAPAPQDPPESD